MPHPSPRAHGARSLLCAGVLLFCAAGCDKREQLEVFDAKAKAEAAACGSVEAPPAPPSGQYLGHGLDIDYDKLVPREDPLAGDLEYGKRVLLDARLLEQMYYDASLGVPHAAFAVCYQELIARNVGRQIARYQSSVRCQTLTDCRLRTEDMPIAQDTASGSRLIAQLTDEYVAQAEHERLETELITSTATLLGAVAVARRATAATSSRQKSTSARAAPSAADAARSAQAAGCLAAGTLVRTAAGFTAIEDLVPGDRVLARDPATGLSATQPVLHSHAVPVDARLVVRVAAPDGKLETLELSAEHPVWRAPRGWTRAGDLAAGQSLATERDSVTVRDMAPIMRPGELAYNIEVAGFHDYFVGRAGVLVHNKPMRAPGPGTWQRVSESMKPRAEAYQRQVTGTSPNNAYVVGGVKFDGFKDGVLLEAKGPGYSGFIKDGTFRDWFRGEKGFLAQIQRQFREAKGTPIEWHIAEADVADAVRVLLKREGITGIRVVHTAVKP